MKFISIVWISAVAIILSGCAATMVNMNNLKNEDSLRLCAAYGHMYTTQSQKEKIADELNRRNAITSKEWYLINANKISIGMSRCALYASWGAPWKTNKSVGGWGEHIQHVYGMPSQYSSSNYVYTRNGRVSSWQK